MQGGVGVSGHCKRAILLAFATMPYQFVHAATASGINHNEHPFAYISQSFAPPHRLRAIGHAGGKSRPGVADEPFQENKETDNMEGQLKEAEEMKKNKQAAAAAMRYHRHW